MIMNGAAVHKRIVPDRNIIPNDRSCFLVGAMNDRAVLNVNMIANGNGVYITANNSIEPKAAMVSGGDIATNGCVGSEPTVCSKGWRSAFYIKD